MKIEFARRKSADDKKAEATQNRAESIRRRRSDQSSPRTSGLGSSSRSRGGSSRNRSDTPIRTGPVIVRGGGFGTPIHRQASTHHPRRQFYVAMDSMGSELRLPAIPLINPGWRLISAILVLLAAIGIFSMLNSPFFQVYAIEVKGLQRINAADLEAILDLENRSIIEINPVEIKEAIAVSFPELADVRITVALPNVVSVSAVERQPVLAWQLNDTTQWIDVEGNVFPARGDAGPLVTIQTDDEIPMAPLTNEEIVAQSTQQAAEAERIAQEKAEPSRASVLAGIAPSAQATSRKANMQLLNAALLLVQNLPEGSILVYDHMNGLGWNDPQGYQVYIGKDLTDFEARYALVQSIVAELNDQGVRPTLISVENINVPFYRVEQ